MWLRSCCQEARGLAPGRFTVSGFVDTVNWWIQNGLKQTPEEVESYFAAVMAAVI